MSADVEAVALRLLAEKGLARTIHGSAECRVGGNNRVVRLDTDAGPFVAKLYFDDADDRRSRLRSEYAFLEYATSLGLRCVPSPLACDPEAHLAIHAYVEGRPFSGSSRLAPAHIEQAVAFFRALNAAPRPGAARLAPASDAAFTIAGQMEGVTSRLARLRDIPQQSDLDREARAFVAELEEAWRKVEVDLGSGALRLGLSVDAALLPEERCVSPSDFGFHNALESDGGRVVFLDFEYAGWDDPAKATCDFFCQPTVPVDRGWFADVAAGFAGHAPRPEDMIRRAVLLFPLFYFQWCLIRLNEFTPVALRRRVFADPAIDVEARKRDRLQSARAALLALPDVARGLPTS